MKKNKVIALTGGIGSGKSSALSYLKSQGFTTLSCDEVCRELYKKRSVKRKLQKMFPTAVDGKLFLRINRTELSELVFNDYKNYNLLYSYTTPLILKATLKKMKKFKTDAVIEVPLLFECTASEHFDGIIVILRDKQKRIFAVTERSSLTEEQVEKRMARQIDYDEYDFSRYSVVYNNGSKVELYGRILRAVNQLVNR